ncbi:hypothetical protein PQX77_015728 [Marasmius sp. AFHP31]|nr:hypothetical protein PQX77_015728 [Marasmius sp. AFHP31]
MSSSPQNITLHSSQGPDKCHIIVVAQLMTTHGHHHVQLLLDVWHELQKTSLQRPFLSPDPPIEEFRSAHAFSDEELQINDTHLERDELTLGVYEAICTSLRDKLAEAERYRQMTETHLMKRRCLGSARQRVPHEVWLLIFTFAFFGANTMSHASLRPVSPPMPISISLRTGYNLPLQYSQVCSQWRDIINAHAKFWSKIRVDGIVLTALPALQHVSDILLRSKPCSIQIEVLNTRDCLLTTLAPRALEVLTLAASRAHSWRSDLNLFNEIDFADRLTLPQLTEVRLHGNLGSYQHGRSCSQIQEVVCAPRLRALDIDMGVHTLLLLGQVFQPCLHVLCLREPTPIDSLNRLVPRFPDLQSLRLQVHIDLSAPPPSYSVILPRLRELVIECHWGPGTVFLAHLTTPVLEKLYLPSNSSTFDTSEILCNFLERSGCPIRTLGMSIPNSFHPSTKSVSDIFGLLSRLQDLNIRVHYPVWGDDHDILTTVFALPYANLKSLVALRIWVGGSPSEQAIENIVHSFLCFFEGTTIDLDHTIQLAELLLEEESPWNDEADDRTRISQLATPTEERLQGICDAGIACSILRYHGP